MSEDQDHINIDCTIWETVAYQKPTIGDYNLIKSNRSGGWYKISGSAKEVLKSRNSELKAKLTTWLVSERLNGTTEPMITSEVINLIEKRTFVSFSKKIETFFRTIDKFKPSLDFTIWLDYDTSKPMFEYLSAIIEAHDIGTFELNKFLDIMVSLGYLRRGEQRPEFYIDSKGWEYLEQLSNKRLHNDNAFVAMWFDPLLNDVYKNHFEKALIDCGYSPPFRIDQHHHTGKVDDEIIARIKQSSLLAVDLTCLVNERPKDMEGRGKIIEARGGVYFEAGFAMGLDIPIVWTCRRDCIDAIHFDTRQYPQILWYHEGDKVYVDDINGKKSLYDALVNRIKAIKKLVS
ncbi:MAG: hypothetical protein WCO61_04890 [Alphaproteobacteria bacterium]